MSIPAKVLGYGYPEILVFVSPRYCFVGQLVVVLDGSYFPCDSEGGTLFDIECHEPFH